MLLRFSAPKSTHLSFRACALLVLTVFLVSGTIAAQQNKQAQEEAAQKLMLEGMQQVAEGSPASLEKAIKNFESARVVIHSLNLPVGEAVMLTMTGYAYNQLEQHQKAIEAYTQSLPLYRAAGEKRGEASTLLHLGLIHNTLGEYQKSLDNFTQAVQLFHAAGDRQGEALALGTLGTLRIHLGKPEEALDYYNKAMETFRAAGFREGEATLLTAVAPLYNAAGQPEKARETLEQALSVSRAAHFRHGEAMALSTLALLSSYLHEIPKALEYSEQALPLYRAEHDRIGESLTLHTLCITYLSLRDYQKGFDYCAQAQQILRAIGDRPTLAFTLKHVAIGERNRGNLDAALTAIESAIAIIESVRTKVINPEYRLSYFAESQDDYELYINLLMRLHQQHPNDGYDGKALQANERARARYLLDTLREANEDIREGVDPALLQREREIQRRLNARTQQIQLSSVANSEAESAAIAEEIEGRIKDLQQVETEIRQTSPHYAALMQPRPLTLREIQTQVLDQDTLLLEYSLGEEHSYVWVVTSSSITSHELAKQSEIENAARNFYNLLNARNSDVKGETDQQLAARVRRSDAALPEAAAALSQLVIAPVAGQLNKKRLAIVADGALHFVPFGALPEISGGPSRTNRKAGAAASVVLLANHEIVNLPSASTLAVIRSEVAGRQKAPKTVAVLADPVFMKDDERVKSGKDKNSTKADNEPPAQSEKIIQRQLVKAAADTGVAKEGLYVPRLRGTRLEAEQIVALVPNAERRLALDFAASRATATSAELSQYRYVHFSTHGLLNSVHPELSGLVFSLVNERGEPQDGFLLAHEIFNLKVPAEVVVLSACETGVGKDIKGEGLVSLTRGFMYAGAPRVVVSLWSVSDLGTIDLMVRFYQKMLKEAMPPAAALRAAQLSLMNDKQRASPYYWASFTLQGEWR
jgi:CHAT domain-containing protein